MPPMLSRQRGKIRRFIRRHCFWGKMKPNPPFRSLPASLHPSLAMALINRSQLTRAVILERLRSAFDGVDARAIMPAGNATGGSGTQRVDEGSLTFWSNGFGSRGRVDGDGNGATVDIKGKGVLIGLDGDLDDGVHAGVAAGYGHDSISQKSASADVDSYYVAAYAGLTNGPASLRLGATHAFQDIDTRRVLSFQHCRKISLPAMVRPQRRPLPKQPGVSISIAPSSSPMPVSAM